MTNDKSFEESVDELVGKLVNKTSKDKIVKNLQDINEKILNYKIIADQYTIYPIWVEAYYKNANKNFIDQSCHDKTNVLGQFMFRKHNKGRGGVDLYLGNPDDDYYLSFLIKLALIKEEGSEELELCSQTRVVDKIGNYLKNVELRKELEHCLDEKKQEVNLDKYINEARSKRDLERYLNCSSLRDGMKRYLLDSISPKLIFSPTSLDLDRNNLKVAKCKRVGLPNDGDNGYSNEELAACYEIRERENNPRSYNTLKEKIDLYVLKEN